MLLMHGVVYITHYYTGGVACSMYAFYTYIEDAYMISIILEL